MALKHTFVSAKADGGDATLVQPSSWNADHVVDGDGLAIVADTSTPTAPSAGKVTLFGKLLAGRSLPGIIGPSGLDSLLQPFFGRNKIGMWNALGNTSSGPVSNFGLPAPTYSGSPTARVVATASLATSMRRIGVVSAATAGSIARATTGALQFFRGDAAGKGGFFAVWRFIPSDAATVADARTFVGLAGSSFGNVNPSSLLNMIGMGTDNGDATFSIMHNDGAGTATKIALGANFPDHALSDDVYELALFCAPNAATVSYQVTRLNTGDTASGDITTDLPASTTLMFPQFGRNNSTTALAVGLDVVGLYMESDN